MTYERWLQRILSVESRVSRLALWAELLGSLPADEAANVLDAVVRGASARAPWAMAAYLPLMDLPALSRAAGPGTLASILSAATERGLDGCLLLLEHPGVSIASQHVGPPPDPVIESLSLGHRKEAARGLRSPILDRVLKDSDPRVVREVLRNPRLRESEVLAIASRRPCPEEVFWQLVECEHWVRRPPVRRAIVYNPYAPPHLAVCLTVTLSDPDLRSIAKAEGLHPAVRDGALQVLEWRRTETRG